MENLEDYLQQEVSQGQFDSSGQFTLSRDKALAKLGHFQLPEPALWLCKLLQAAVACGSPEFSASLLHRETLVYVKWPGKWTPELVAEALSNPEPGPDRALWHLKQAFWSVGLHERRIFSLQLQHWNEVLVWDGQRLRSRASPNGVAVLRVSQWVREEKPPPSLFGRADWSRRNAELMEQMRKRCFASPIPVKVDKMRLDALQFCPSHGHSEHTSLVSIGYAQCNLPPFPVPAATQAAQLPPQVGLLGLFAIHFWRHSKDFSHDRHRCAIHWIADGLAIDTRTFLETPGRCCSFGLIASAEGLELDLSGMRLREERNFQTRFNEVVLAAAPMVAATYTDTSHLVVQARSNKGVEAVAFGALGVCLLYMAPPLGLAVLGIGALNHLKRGTIPEEEMSRLVSNDLHLLKIDFQNLAQQAARNLGH